MIAERKNDSKLTVACNAELRQSFKQFCKVRGLSVGHVLSMLASFASKPENASHVHRFIYVESEPAIYESTIIDEKTNTKKRSMMSASLTDTARKALYDVCEEFQIPMSVLVRKFMIYCVQHNDVPFPILRKGHCKKNI